MTGTSYQYEQGVIHGRFQVLHNDHLTYLLAGKALCRHLEVGITNPDPSRIREESADPHRSAQSANPLTFFERYQLVRAALTRAGPGLDDFSVVPLPMHDPRCTDTMYQSMPFSFLPSTMIGEDEKWLGANPGNTWYPVVWPYF